MGFFTQIGLAIGFSTMPLAANVTGSMGDNIPIPPDKITTYADTPQGVEVKTLPIGLLRNVEAIGAEIGCTHKLEPLEPTAYSIKVVDRRADLAGVQKDIVPIRETATILGASEYEMFLAKGENEQKSKTTAYFVTDNAEKINYVCDDGVAAVSKFDVNRGDGFEITGVYPDYNIFLKGNGALIEYAMDRGPKSSAPVVDDQGNPTGEMLIGTNPGFKLVVKNLAGSPKDILFKNMDGEKTDVNVVVKDYAELTDNEKKRVDKAFEDLEKGERVVNEYLGIEKPKLRLMNAEEITPLPPIPFKKVESMHQAPAAFGR